MARGSRSTNRVKRARSSDRESDATVDVTARVFAAQDANLNEPVTGCGSDPKQPSAAPAVDPTSIESTKRSILALEADIEELKAGVRSANQTIASLEAEIAALEDEIAALEDKIGALEA